MADSTTKTVSSTIELLAPLRKLASSAPEELRKLASQYFSKDGRNSNKYVRYLLVGSLLYPLVCSALRFQRAKSMYKQVDHVYPTRESMAQMTTADAQRILSQLGKYEFPTFMKTSLQFALFKTYGIPTISKLLVATGMFTTAEHASKRYTDTGVLIGEFIAHDPRDERTKQAIARMNYLHSSYIKSGKITNADLLYTLSVFITQPTAWINQYEWRQMSDVEVCALGTFWKSIGDAMEIQYNGYLKKDSWKDGIEFVDDISQWAYEYEIAHLVPAQTNKTTADQLTPLLLFYVPNWLKPSMSQAVGVIMEERLRNAMMYKNPSLEARLFTNFALFARKFFLRYLSLPRLFPVTVFSEKNLTTGRYNQKEYLVHPYYVKPTFWNRWGPTAWFTWLAGGAVPGGKDGEKYMPEGYLFEEVGPPRKKGQGKQELENLKEKIGQSRPAGCPFA